MSAIDSARRRMAAFLVTDAIQARIQKLGVHPGEFAADAIEQYAKASEGAFLDVSEAFAVMELAAKCGVSMRLERGEARLAAKRGRAVIQLGFAGLYALSKRVESA